MTTKDLYNRPPLIDHPFLYLALFLMQPEEWKQANLPPGGERELVHHVACIYAEGLRMGAQPCGGVA